MSVADRGSKPEPVRSFRLDQLEEVARLVGTQVERTLADGTSVTVTLGDVSGDGIIDERDFEVLRQLVSEGQEGEEFRRHISPRVLAACDLDGDGVVDVRDILILLSALLARNRELASQDDLTGLNNRRAFREKADLKIMTARRYGIPMCCLALDLDHFKAINDTHGHAVGDAALQQLADILRRSTRDSDVLCRFGGDEFLVLLDHLEPGDVQVVVGRILAGVEEARVQTMEGAEVRLGVSIGVAPFSPEMELVQLVHEADQALYQAKRAGRGRAMGG